MAVSQDCVDLLKRLAEQAEQSSDDSLRGIETLAELLGFAAEAARRDGDDEADVCELICRGSDVKRDDLREAERTLRLDAAVKGADPVTLRPGFAATMDRIASNGVRVILVESPDRFARDLIVQLTGHDFLRGMGVSLIPASAPSYFTEETPTATMVRQILGAVAQFEKSSLVAELRAARNRKLAETSKCGGRKSYRERDPELVALAKALRRPDKQRRPISLAKVAAALAERGKLASSGKPFSASAVANMLAQ